MESIVILWTSSSSLAEYADLHGRIPEQRIWHILVDLVKVRGVFIFPYHVRRGLYCRA